MHLGDQGIAFLPDGSTLPGGPYPVYASLEVDEHGAASGEVHFASEPRYPAPISIGTEFGVEVPHPNSILGDNVSLRVRLLDDSGSVTGYVVGSTAQFRPPGNIRRSPSENLTKDDLLPILRRKMFDQDLVAVSSAASEAAPASLLMLDLDHFKSVNDTHGHPVGDEVLIDCAKAVVRRCQHKGEVYRFGGEEMAVILPNFSGSEAVALAESIRREIEKGKMSGKQLAITVSIGVATAPDHATDAKQLLTAADEALYAAKGLGRNLVRIAGEQSGVQQASVVQRRLPDPTAEPRSVAQDPFGVQVEVLKEYPDGPFLHVTTNRDVGLTQLDYLDENGAKLDSDAIDQFGQDFNILIDNRKITMINNLKHTNGRPFPVKFRLRMQLEGRPLLHEVPALVEPSMKHINGTMTGFMKVRG